jgi:hypothetical protein
MRLVDLFKVFQINIWVSDHGDGIIETSDLKYFSLAIGNGI